MLNTRVEVEALDIDFFDQLIIEGVYVEDLNKDTLLYAGAIKLKIDGYDSRRNYLQLSEIIFDRTYFNLKKYKRGEDFNFQFIIDAFDSGKKDTTTKNKSFEVLCSNFKLHDCTMGYSLLYKKQAEWGFDPDFMRFNHLNGSFYSLQVKQDTLYAYMKNLNFQEKSGFKLNRLNAFLKAHETFLKCDNLEAYTNESHLNGNVHFNFSSWEDFDDVYNKVVLTAEIKPSTVQMADVAYFTPELKGINKILKIKGKAKGYISDFTAKDLELEFGFKTRIKGNLKMTGLPYINETLIDFRIKELITDKTDMEGIPLPPFTSGEHLVLPENINSLGDIYYTGDYTGFYNDFVTYGNFKTNLGHARSDIKINYNLETEITSYSGKMVTHSFQLGKLLDEKELGSVALNGEIKGKGFSLNTLNAEFKGDIQQLEYKGYNYQQLSVNGHFRKKQFEGFLKAEDPNLKLEFDGKIDLQRKIPEIDFLAKADYINLSNLNFVPAADQLIISTNMIVDVKGSSIDDILGNISFEDLIIGKKEKKYALGNVLFNSQKFESGNKLIISSDMVDARIIGKYNFQQMGLAVKYLAKHYVKNLFHQEDLSYKTEMENFEYDIRIKKPNDLTALFVPALSFQEECFIDGTFNAEEHLFNLNLQAGALTLSGIKIDQLKIHGDSNSEQIKLNTSIKKATFNDSLWMDNVQFDAYSEQNKIISDLNWKNISKTNNSGKLISHFMIEPQQLYRLQFTEGNISLQDSSWTINKDNLITFDSSGIQLSDLILKSSGQVLEADGKISKNIQDILTVQMNNLNMASFNSFLSPYDVELSGKINGYLKVSNLYEVPIFSTNLNLEDFILNKEEFGKGNIIATYYGGDEKIQIDGAFGKGHIPSIKTQGLIYPLNKDNMLDLSFELHNTNLKLLQGYVNGILTDLKGYANGKIYLKGNGKHPQLSGEADIEKGSFLADYLKTSYTFNGKMTVKENLFEVKDANVFDEKGSPSKASFSMYHNYFKDFKFDISVDAQNLFCLNTSLKDNNLFYGKAFATGLINISGPADNIVMNISAKTEKGTTLFIPLDQATEVTEYNFIRFKTADTTKVNLNTQKKIDLTGIQMNFDLEITPDAQFQMVFDSKVGDVIKGRGNGNIKMEINTIGSFDMFGNFAFTDGDYLFTFENALNKKFRIDPGSNITWNGDPYNANINVTAIYKTKTALRNLLQDSSSEYTRNIPVNVQLKLKDKLFNPTISFGIDLPTQQNNESLKAQINSIIGNENTQELNRQVFSLLMIGSFLPPSGSTPGATRITEGVGNSSSELLSAQLNNWLSQISKSFNFGLNYKPGTELTSNQVEVAVSTQLFDNRLSIDGNFGVANRQQSTAASSLVDVTMEYKLTNDGKLRVMAYNKPNDFINIFTQGYNKQGVGLVYKEEFNSLNELGKRYKNNWKNKKEKRKKKKADKQKEVKP